MFHTPISVYGIDWWKLTNDTENEKADFLIVDMKSLRYSFFKNVDLSDDFDNQNLNFILNKSVF